MLRKWCLSALLLMALPAFAGEKNEKTSADKALDFFRVRGNVSYNSARWQVALDSALMIDSTVATLWQWKGMPYFKNGDYATAMKYYAKAVHYKPEYYLALQAFMKATFMKDYESAIPEFLTCIEKRYGAGLMDHSYEFFLALCYKETGQFDKAKQYLQQSIDDRTQIHGDSWVHYNEWLYMGIVTAQLGQPEEAMGYIDKCLREFPGFPNALYQKALLLQAAGKKDEALALMSQAVINIQKGMRSTEDNDFYVNYPNQVFVEDLKVAMAAMR